MVEVSEYWGPGIELRGRFGIRYSGNLKTHSERIRFGILCGFEQSGQQTPGNVDGFHSGWGTVADGGY